MAGVGWIMTIILGGLAGWIAEKITKSEMGLIGNIILGILGAVLLNAILRGLDVIPPEGWLWQCIIAIVGAVIIIYGWRLIRGRRA